jgi:DNA-binding CsgD family transcriptional regulator
MAGLIGRDAELAAITAALQRPDLAGVVLTGDAGAGKTHLLDAALELARSAGFAVARITGTQALAELPLAAFVPLLPGRPRGDAGDLVALRDTLRDHAAGRPLVLGVDDAHLLDDSSAAVTHQLAADLTAFVIGSVRNGEIPPDAITALWKDRLVDRIAIGPLDRDAIGQLGEATLGAPLDPLVEDEIWRRSDGNPLFARELLLAASEAGSLAERSGRIVRVADLPAPGTVTELLSARLEALDDDERRAVGLVALGGALDVDVLEQLVDPDALIRLEAARIFTADELHDRLEVRFVHPLHADAVRHLTGRLVARKLRRELADALEASGGATTDDVLRIVTLRLESGGRSSPDLLARSARIALRRNDALLAERLAAATFEAEPSLSAATVLAGALLEQGRAADALAALTDPRIDRAEAADHERARADLLEVDARFWGLGDADTARAILRERRPTDGGWQVRFDAALGALEACTGNPAEALRLVPPNGPAAATPAGAVAVLVALTSAGRPAAALDAIELPDARLGGTWALVAVNRVYTMVEAGLVHDAGELAIERWEEATRSGDLHARTTWSLALGWTESMQGRTAVAAQWFKEAAHLAPLTAASLYGRRWALGGALYCAAVMRDADAVASALAELDATAHHDATAYELIGRRGRAWARALTDDIDGAVAELLDLAASASHAGRDGHAVEVLTDVARLGRAAQAVPLLDALDPGGLDGSLLPVLVECVRSFAAGDGPRLALTAEHLHDVGAVVLAAEAASAAWASASENGEDQGVVVARQRRAQELSFGLADVGTPALVSAPRELPLSRREREIAVLVAEGRTSREVAEQLVIGVRTVESHLARVYDKLGIRSRADLADALGLAGAPT